MPPPTDYTGQKKGKLTAIKWTGEYTSGRNKKRLWLFQCDCGNKSTHVVEKWVKGDVKSCGCLKGMHEGVTSMAYQVYREYQKVDRCNNLPQGDLTFDQFQHLTQLSCAYCGSPPQNKRKLRIKNGSEYYTYNGLDALDPRKPHDFANVVPCCWTCNERKSSWDHLTFISWVERIYLYLQSHPVASEPR